jgi:hypothetical protein
MKPANFKWTKEKCHKEALKYNHKKDFKINSKGAYPAALLNGWKDEICSHMTPLGNKCERLIYRFIFPDNYFYVGLTCDSNRRKKQHLTKSDSVVYNHIQKTKLQPIYEELTKYLDIKQAQIQEEYWKNKSIIDGYLCLNKAKTGALGDNSLFWSKEKCQEKAKNYKNKTEFRLSCGSAYNSAKKNGWLDEICSHMISKYKHWNKEKCRQDALKYKTRYDYSHNSCSSYDSARRNGWLDEICSHMIKLRKTKGYWTLENSILEAKKYSKSSELKKNSSRAYKIICDNNLIDIIYSKKNKINGKIHR